MQKALLVLALLGVSMVIGDGVLTAAASVMSAMSGLQVANSSISNGEQLLLTCVSGSQQLLPHCGREEHRDLTTHICTMSIESAHLDVSNQFAELLLCPQQAAQSTLMPGALQWSCMAGSQPG